VLKNPGIDGVTDWIVRDGATYDGTVDFDGCTGNPGSGSLLIPPMLGPNFHQCINTGIASNTPYVFGYYFRGSGTGYCDVGYYSDANCTVSISGAFYSVGADSAGAWMAAQVNAPSPAGTASVDVHCSGVAGNGNFDRFYLSTAGVY
jgi:hypothetical protein